MPKYHKGQPLTYKPHNALCKVVNVTPYHESDDPHAFVTVELKNRDLRTIPVSVQDDYLTTDKPVPFFQHILQGPAKVKQV